MKYLSKVQMIVLSFVLLMPVMGWAATYYLDDINGNNANPGTSAAPWKTLNRAYTWYSGSGPKVQEGDTVIFRDGEYGAFRESTHDGRARLFYRNNWIIYKAESGHTPILTRIDIYNMDKWGGAGNGNSYLIFDGFEIQGSVGFLYTSYAQVRNCTITPSSPPYEGFYAPYVIGTGVAVRDGHYITIENNEISNVYRGISNTSGTDNVVIRNNVIHYIGEDGIGAPISHVLIEGNHIYDTNKYRTPIAMYGTKSGDFIEEEKVILDIGGEGIVHRWTGSYLQVFVTTEWPSTHHGEGGTISGQTSGATLLNISKVDPSHTDGIQIDTDNIIDIVIINNIIHDIPYQGIKLQSTNGGNKDVIVANNLVYNVSRGMSINGYNPVSVYNNTFEEHVRLYTDVDNMYNNIFLGGILESGGGSINHGNNIFENSPGFANATELVNTIPEFVDAANGDFHLTPGSVAIDFGDPSYAPATDIEGNPRDAKPDAGCYEYGAIRAEPDPDPPPSSEPEPQPQPETELQPEPEVDPGQIIPDQTLLRISNNIIKSGGNSAVTINCDVKDAGVLSVKIYDAKGREIITLWNKHEEPGTVPITWLGEDNSNNKVGSGIYMVHMECGGYKETRKIAVIK